ncbi:S8 family serine peptidase [Microvirga sp. VF16]|uniref:S8 family peptidase n=1 Tax=Microvirga sp. VF16 TaxID=2807101 RepID=UPI00193DB890|nr:S8 family serine peptidase [Microvirga sp. VF16]QRM35414.1 S8 family serine peptidase [Microvirga sp. VF16]
MSDLEPLFARDIPPVEKPVQRDKPILTEIPEADRLIRAKLGRDHFKVSGKGLSVAVLDTGLRTTHIDFKGRVAAQRNFTSDYGGDQNNAADENGHGTNVAGIICANKDHIGIAPDSQVIPLKVLHNSGGGSFDAIKDALQWVLDHGETHNISAVCMSLGDSGNYVSDTGFPLDALQARIRALKAKGVVCCVAAGNDYFTHGSVQGMGYPAIFRETVSVGAVYDFDEGSFSYGSGAKAFSTAADRITPFSQRLHETVGGEAATDVFAPGAPIRSSGISNDRGESIQHGTSQATPVVTGVVLLVQELFFRAHNRLPAVDDVVQWLRSSSTRVVDGDDENDNVTHTNLAFRRVDALASLEAVSRSIATAAFMAGGSSPTPHINK